MGMGCCLPSLESIDRLPPSATNRPFFLAMGNNSSRAAPQHCFNQSAPTLNPQPPILTLATGPNNPVSRAALQH